jgi:16S rRNA (adenine1518-N6/adenine1519-N6)-dimethyltransferase
VIANIPYYITSKIIRLFLETENPPSEMILMTQKEVAERITEKAGKMSLLSVSVQYYADPKILFEVSRKSFFPVPEVDSAVIKIEKIKKQKASIEETKNFFRIVKAGFSAKRKTLINNLSNSLHVEKNIIEEKIKTAGLKPTVRAQELSIEDWKTLSKNF